MDNYPSASAIGKPGLHRKSRTRSALHPVSLIKYVAASWKRRCDYEHLLELPDYLLDDAGFTREQIFAIRRRRPF